MPQEECKGGDCPLRPQFDGPDDAPAASDKKVRLSTHKYVQLLIDARETDPDCWPPGLEQAAAMIENARAIEDSCIARWGEFDPDKLPRDQNLKYLEIQLALDALQEEAPDAPLSMESALDQARHVIETESDATESKGISIGDGVAGSGSGASAMAEPGGYALPASPPPTGEGFFAAGFLGANEFFMAQGAPSLADEAPHTALPEHGWLEMAPPQRPENYA